VVFEVEQFIAQCRAALREHSPQLAVKDLMAETCSHPDEIGAALGPATRAEIATLHHSPELTVLRVIWAPRMTIYPHDHRMWAVIGLYGGQEDNTFFGRTRQGLARRGDKVLERGDATLLGDEVIHAVTNPRGVFAEAIHIYGGDFFNEPRSEWDPLTLEERAYDIERARQVFADANAAYFAPGSAREQRR
jgi:predicted metal-dependent enzyme (double-stranded beta helix superfamily)